MAYEYADLPDIGPLLDFKARVRAPHIKSARDVEFTDRTHLLHFNCEASHRGVGDEVRAICVVAPAGSGKTTLINYHIDRLPYFQPSIDAYGDTVSPILKLKLSSLSTARSMMNQLLQKMRVFVNYSKKKDPEMADIVVGHMKELGYKYLFLDELQHGARGTQTGFMKKMQDSLKGIVDSDIWPVHAILAGTEDVLPLFKDDQLRRRTRMMRLAPLSLKYIEFLKTLIEEIVCDAAGMTYSFESVDEVCERLMHAASYAMGTVILLLQHTCFDAFLAGSNVITIQDLEKTYQTKSGCRKKDNIFLVDGFKNIKPVDALADMLRDKDNDDDEVLY